MTTGRIRSLNFSLLHVIDIPCFHSFFLGLECFQIGNWREQYPEQLLCLGQVLLLNNSQEFAEWWIYAWSCINFYWEESYVETPLNQLLFYHSNHLCSLTAAKGTTITVSQGNVEWSIFLGHCIKLSHIAQISNNCWFVCIFDNDISCLTSCS